MRIKLSDYVMNFIAAQGVRHMFMLPGGGSMHLVDSLGNSGALIPVPLLHEQSCAIAAEAYARVTNNLGAVLVTTGPGGTNAITGVAGAWLESTPCLVISGQVKRADMKRDSGVRQLGPQELDIISMVRPITKYAVTIDEPASIRYHLEKAVSLARHGRPGPVWLEIPLDVQAAFIEPGDLVGFDASLLPAGIYDPGRALSHVEETISLLNRSQRPVLLAGQGIKRSGAGHLFLAFIKALGVPVLTTWPAADLIPGDHCLNFGKPGMIAPRGANLTLQNADCLLVIGARLDASLTGFNDSNFAKAAKKIIVDVDRHEIDKLKTRIDVRAEVDAGCFMKALLKVKERLTRTGRKEWFQRCREWKLNYPVVLPEYRQEAEFVNAYHFVEVLADALDEGEIIVPGSSGSALDIFWLAFKVKQNQRLFSAGGLGAMGFGLPASIGGCLADGGRRVIVINGDGGFQLNIQELASVANLKLPIKYFILNNGGYASIRNMQHKNFNSRLVACDAASGLPETDLVGVARAYGLKAGRITQHAGMRNKIAEALNCEGPFLCDVLIDPDQQVMPKVVSRVNQDGSMESTLLEDLWPFLDRSEFQANMITPASISIRRDKSDDY